MASGVRKEGVMEENGCEEGPDSGKEFKFLGAH